METATTSRFFPKLIACALAGTTSAFAVHEVTRKVFSRWTAFLDLVSLLLFLAALACAVIWHFREKKSKRDIQKAFAFWKDVSAYFVALDLCMFAWRKIFALQFYAPQALLDKPVSALNGEQLTIAYFAHSYAFGLCLAALQLAGAILLLFSKTRLAGILLLVPVLANIILIDFFYDIDTGALVMAVVLLLALVYLLSDHFDAIRALLTFSTTPYVDGNSVMLRNAARFLIVAIPLAMCVLLKDFPNRHPELTGKYDVKSVFVDGRREWPKSCADSTLTLVYFDDNRDAVFEYNGQKNWKVGHFDFDEKRRKLQIKWRYPRGFDDTFAGTLLSAPKGKMTLDGFMGSRKIRVEMVKREEAVVSTD